MAQGGWVAGAPGRGAVVRLGGLARWAPPPSPSTRRPLLALPQVALQSQQAGQVQEVALAEQADVAGAQRQG